MPSKSGFRKRFSPSFAEDRERSVREFLRAVMAIRADVSECALRHFLGIVKDAQAQTSDVCDPHRAATVPYLSDLVGPMVEPLRIQSEPLVARLPREMDSSIDLEDVEEDEETDEEENSSVLDADSHLRALETLKLQNAGENRESQGNRLLPGDRHIVPLSYGQ